MNGNVTARHDYHPFGEEITGSGGRSGHQYMADEVRKGFTGHVLDKESGLNFARTRFIGPHLGRFTSADRFDPPTFGHKGRREVLFTAQPQNWNKYAYARNNPINLIDLNGYHPVGAAGVLLVKRKLPEIAIRAGIGALVNGGAEALRQWYDGKGYNLQDIGAATIGGGAGGATQGLLPQQIAGFSGAIGTVVTGVVERSLDSDQSIEAFDQTAMAGDALAGGIADQLARPVSKIFRHGRTRL